MGRTQQHVSYILLAEFDIDQGSQIAREFPWPTGIEESLLAEQMLPDGVHDQMEDWTMFFLNQTPANTVARVLSEEGSTDGEDGEDKPELLYVLNLVRTKMDKTVRRGAIVKALAICTHLPYIDIFKPVLLLALEDYFQSPTLDCLERLFEAVNAMDISGAPILTRPEKLIMRVAERKDVFAEKFQQRAPPTRAPSVRDGAHSPDPLSLLKPPPVPNGPASLSTEKISLENGQRSRPTSIGSQSTTGSSVVWVGEEKEREREEGDPKARLSIDTSSASSHHHGTFTGTSSTDSHSNSGSGVIRPHLSGVKDTHFYDTSILYKGHTLPIRIPLSRFPEEVGDFSLIALIQTFSAPGAVASGPVHPHLHTNGTATPPIIILFNALITQKRVLFLGYGKPAGLVANYVLASCAMASGSGCYLRGFTERAFPYANLTMKSLLDSVPGYIAGVTNPIFESMSSWDVLCNIETGKVTVHKDIRAVAAPPALFPAPPTGRPEEDFGRMTPAALGKEGSVGSIGPNGPPSALGAVSKDSKADNSDLIFLEDIIAQIREHYGEATIRWRFADYVNRFVRIASRYEEETTGSTAIGYVSSPFSRTAREGQGSLGSGIIFTDDMGGLRELAANAARVEGWKRTKCYENWTNDFHHHLDHTPMQGFDLPHQIWRLRYGQNMSDPEAALVFRTLADNTQTYEQVVELLAQLPPHAGGLLPISFGLFHQLEAVRDLTVDILTSLREHHIGIQFLHSLNQFHRYAYVRLAHTREVQGWKESSNAFYVNSSGSAHGHDSGGYGYGDPLTAKNPQQSLYGGGGPMTAKAINMNRSSTSLGGHL